MTDLSPPPAAPPGWGDERLLWLLDPGGDAVAWVSPDDGGNTIAFALRHGDVWRHVLFVESPDALRARPTRYGCPVLFPFPGYAREARYQWNGEERALPVNAPDGRSHVHGFAHDRPWQVVERSANTVVLAFATASALTDEEHTAYPFDILVRQVVSVVGGTLQITIEATNRGETPAPVGLGLHPYVDVSLLGTERGEIVVTLPGTKERALDGAVPTGELKATPAREFNLAEAGTLLCRTGLEDGAAVTLRGQDGRAVRIDLRGDWSDVALFIPPDQPSVSIEPLTCALSAASAAPGSPESLPRLAPSEHVAGRMCVRLAPPEGESAQPH